MHANISRDKKMSDQYKCYNAAMLNKQNIMESPYHIEDLGASFSHVNSSIHE